MMEPATIWKETHLQIEETVDPLWYTYSPAFQTIIVSKII
jgi:hypothetical protein